MTVADMPDASESEIVVECDLDAAPERVWRALTVPELVEHWLGVQPAGEGDGAGPAYQIVEAEPFSRLRYAWRDAGSSQPDSIVTFDLAPLPGGGTWFRLTHGASADRRQPVAANSNMPRAALAA